MTASYAPELAHFLRKHTHKRFKTNVYKVVIFESFQKWFDNTSSCGVCNTYGKRVLLMRLSMKFENKFFKMILCMQEILNDLAKCLFYLEVIFGNGPLLYQRIRIQKLSLSETILKTSIIRWNKNWDSLISKLGLWQ